MSANKLPTFDLLDRMGLLVSNARAIPLSGKIMVEKEEFSSLMRRLQDSIPVDLQQAKQLLEMEQQIIGDSKRQAESTTREATQKANDLLEDATAKANAMVTDAQTRAADTLRSATDQANAMLADAQARANALVADAQTRAQQLVSDSEIVARAQAEAQELLESAHLECEQYSARVQDTVHQLMENADAALTQQLDSLRAMRQDLTLNP